MHSGTDLAYAATRLSSIASARIISSKLRRNAISGYYLRVSRIDLAYGSICLRVSRSQQCGTELAHGHGT
eukprot:1566720-Rhodomonas_salina.2